MPAPSQAEVEMARELYALERSDHPDFTADEMGESVALTMQNGRYTLRKGCTYYCPPRWIRSLVARGGR